jgi:rRNA pseudouridine-1189 N-methylase Emg1 (Nep1/Mra1 family)
LWKYAAAAVVAGLIFTIGWLRLHTPTGAHGNHPSVDVASNLVKVSDQDLQNYLDDQNDQNPTLTEPMNSTATLDINDSDVKSLLGDVPDGDLKTYMEEHGGPNDIATN